MCRIMVFVGSLLVAVPAFAQQMSLQQQVDGGVAEGTAIFSNMRAMILQQAAHVGQIEAQNDALNKQVAALTKERDDLKAAAEKH